MKRAALILARGFEESESLTIADVLIRAGLTCELTGLEEEIVEGAHGIQVKCDRVLGEDLTDYDMIILPGGYGLGFSLLCAIPHVFIGGPGYAVGYFIG